MGTTHAGWLASVHDPAPAPLWRDPRSIHRLITLDHLLRMRSGIGFPVSHGDARVTLGFENSAVYQDAGNAFEAAQRSIVATAPGLSALGLHTPPISWWDFERSGTKRFQADPIAGSSWKRYSSGSYGLVYSRTSMVFHDLEHRLKEGVLARGFADYYRRWHHRHPSTADLEEVAAHDPRAIVREAADPSAGLYPFQARKLAFGLGLRPEQINQAVQFMTALYRAYVETDASLVEINPFITTTDGRLFALDAKMNFDDNALFRHKDIKELRDVSEEDALAATADGAAC